MGDFRSDDGRIDVYEDGDELAVSVDVDGGGAWSTADGKLSRDDAQRLVRYLQVWLDADELYPGVLADRYETT